MDAIVFSGYKVAVDIVESALGEIYEPPVRDIFKRYLLLSHARRYVFNSWIEDAKTSEELDIVGKFLFREKVYNTFWDGTRLFSKRIK